MALSEEEQKLLEQMEAALAAEDPRLADALRGRRRGWYQRRVVVSVVAFAVGVTVLVIGMDVHPLVSVAGFLIMLASTVVAVAAWRQPVVDIGDPAPSSGRPDGRIAPPRQGRRPGDDDLNL